MFATCSQHFRNIFATCSQHFRDVFATFSQHFRNIDRPRPSASVRVRPRLIDELITYVLHMGNDYVTGGRTRPHPSASVRPVRTRPGPSTRPWPVRTFSHLTHIYLLQTQAHSTDQVYWVGPTQVSYALVVMPAYHVGSPPTLTSTLRPFCTGLCVRSLLHVEKGL